MRNILIFGLLACAVSGLSACNNPDNDNQTLELIIPEKYQGEWYNDGELACEIFSDKIIFFQFPIHLDFDMLPGVHEEVLESLLELVVDKFFDLSSVNKSFLMFDVSNAKNMIITRLENNYLFIGLGASILVEGGKEALVIVGHFYLDRGEQ